MKFCRSLSMAGWMILASILVLGLSVPVHAAPPAGQDSSVRASLLAVKGAHLSQQQAQQLENDLKQNPGDLSSRTELIGYYFDQIGSMSARKALQRHVLWVISNHPEASIAGIPPATLNPHQDGKAYHRAVALWKQAVAAHPSDPAVIRHAADFFFLSDPPFAKSLIEKGQGLEPKNRYWSMRLGESYSLQARKAHGPDCARLYGESLAAYQDAYARTQNDRTKSYLLNFLAISALDAGEAAKAKSYAERALDAAKKWPKDWNAGNDVNQAYTVLGLLALREGHVDEAKACLIASAKTKGSPQLKSFGPNMSLAWALLQKGEKKAVLQYLDLCGHFWAMGTNRLNKWSKTIKDGGTPDFGARSLY